MQSQIIKFEDNPEIDLAYNFIEHTSKNVFLTGRAGTGKTTFLHKFKSVSSKKTIVLAPTGLAAINSGAVTLHSFFQLPFGPYVPNIIKNHDNKHEKKEIKYNKTKINIIKSINLLIIDEISMVRADVLDAVDETLRRFRDDEKPFGGLQILMIGDLQQLAPVTKSEDWNILKNYYKSPFFFESKALKEANYITIELQKIYRQTDENFINLLENLRDATVTPETLLEINKRYIPGFQYDNKNTEGYITLTSHNYISTNINEQKLKDLDSREYSFVATIEGDFPENSYPTDEILRLKKGAQVMFIKNDLSYDKRFYNGKIGIISHINEDTIEVTPFDKTESILVEPREWTNTNYTINKETREIVETVMGRFMQYPLKLAWSITIHKSQGLTFEKAIIDAASSFTHGQVYVALSRCKKLENIVLSSPIQFNSIISDINIKKFHREIKQKAPSKNILLTYKKYYYLELLFEQFDFGLVEKYFKRIENFIYDNLSMFYSELIDKWTACLKMADEEIFIISKKFQKELLKIYNLENNILEDNIFLRERVVKASDYFIQKFDEILYDLLKKKIELENKETKKQLQILLETASKELTIKYKTLLDTKTNGFVITNYLRTKSIASIKKDL